MIIDYDCLGNCVNCHKDIGFIKEGRIYWSANREIRSFILSDGSKAETSICSDCNKDFDRDKLNRIWQSIVKGWEMEPETPDWTKAQKSAYLEVYSKKNILSVAI